MILSDVFSRPAPLTEPIPSHYEGLRALSQIPRAFAPGGPVHYVIRIVEWPRDPDGKPFFPMVCGTILQGDHSMIFDLDPKEYRVMFNADPPEPEDLVTCIGCLAVARDRLQRGIPVDDPDPVAEKSLGFISGPSIPSVTGDGK